MNKGIIKKVSCMALAGLLLMSGQSLGAYSREQAENKLELMDASSLMANKVLGYGSSYDFRKYQFIQIEDVGSTNASWAIVASKMMEYSNKYLGQVSAKHIDFSTANNSTTTTNENAHSRALGAGGNMQVALGYLTSGRGPISKENFEWDGKLNRVALSDLTNKKPSTIVESYRKFPSMYKISYDNGQGGKVTMAFNDPIIYMSNSTMENIPSSGTVNSSSLRLPAGTTISATKDMVSYSGGEIEQIRESIKEHIIKYGSVSAQIYRNDTDYFVYRTGGDFYLETYCYDDGDGGSYCYRDWERHYNPLSTTAYYCNEKKLTPNHDVLIIGWDDDYQVVGAPGKGAYLVMDAEKFYTQYYKDWYEGWRKSQNAIYTNGTWFERRNLTTVDTNYYYVSYYDYYIESNVYGIKDTASATYSKIYQHDQLGLSSSVNGSNYSNVAYGANVFDRTQGQTEVKPEALNAISIASESKMQYEVYVNPKNGDLTEEKLIKVATTGVMEPGYNTIHFDTPIYLTGEKFAVAVKYIAVSEDGYTNTIARIGVEAPTQMKYKMLENNKTETVFESIKYWSANAKSSQKQSYVGTTLNDWEDLYFLTDTLNGNAQNYKNYNICIKAYVSAASNYKVPAEQIVLKNKVVDAFGDYTEEELPEVVQIIKGDSITLGATVLPTDTADKAISWRSDNSKVATVDKNGLVTTHSAGIATIRAEMTNAPGIYAECKIDVRVPVDSFVLNKNEVTILAGETNVLAAIIGPEDATTTKVEWSSSNKEVVKVTEDGLLIGLKQGSAIVTAVLRDENGLHTATCKVTVPVSLVVNVTGVSLNKTNIQLVKGTRETLQATITPSDATNTAVVWSSSNKNVAIVNSNGRITAIAPGTATITVTTVSSGETATCKVTVVEEQVKNVTGVSISASNVTLEKDKTRTLVATVTPSDAANKSVVWSSNNLSVAEVNSDGKITAIAPGTAEITATTVDGDFTAKCTVTVTKPVIKVTGLTINKTFVELEKGNTQQLIAEVQPSNADNTTIMWSTANDKVATVDDTGNVTAVGYGETVITAKTVDGNYTKQCTILVPEVVAVTGIEISATELVIEKGITSELKVNVVPENANNQNINIEIENDKIATMAGDGVKAIEVGQTTITFTTEDGGFTKTCTINVTEPTKDIIISSEDYQINEENEIYEVPENTTVEDLQGNITTNGTITEIKDKDGNTLESDETIGTGTTITVEKEITIPPTEEGGQETTETVKETYVVKIAGDLDGDGVVSVVDFGRLRQYLLGKLELSELENEVADVNSDGKINLVDLSILRSKLVEG